MKTLDVLPGCATPKEGCQNHIANASYRTAWGHFSEKYNVQKSFQMGSIEIWCIYSSKFSGTFTIQTIRHLLLSRGSKAFPFLVGMKTVIKTRFKRNFFIVCVFAHVNYVHKIIKSTAERLLGGCFFTTSSEVHTRGVTNSHKFLFHFFFAEDEKNIGRVENLW